ncbi:MAG: lipopolysaccharide biosynthesis protein [Hyphomicrobiales bacterium]
MPPHLGEKLAPVSAKLDLAFSNDGPRSKAARAALLTFAVRVFNAALAYISQIILARLMGQYEYGVFAIIWVWVMVLATFCALGYPSALLRFIPELYKTGRYRELRMVLVRGSLVNVGFASLLGATGIAIVLLMPDLLERAFVLPLMLAAICMPMITLMINQGSIAQAFDWPDLVNIPAYVARPSLVLGLFCVFVLVGTQASAVTAMMASLVGIWLVVVGQFLMLRFRVRERLLTGARDNDNAIADGGKLTPYLRAALPMLAVEGIFYLIINTDVMVAGLFVTPHDVAVYYAAAKTLALVHFVYFAIRIATAHKIAEYHALGNEAALRATLRDAIHWTFWPSLGLALALWAFGGLVLGLFGAGFAEEGMPFLAILLAGVVIRATIGPAEALLTMANEQKLAAWIYACVFVTNLSLNFALIALFGLIGAAIATAVSMTVETLLLSLAIYRKLGVVSFIGAVGRLKAQGVDRPAAGPAE